MKNLLYFFILAPFFLQGQENCQGSFTEYYLNSNNIRASFFPRGNKFTDGTSGAFLAPYPSSGKLSTIFASSPWLAGFDDAGNFKIAEETYPSQVSYNFNVGPLTNIGLPYPDCANFDKVWSVFREDILSHMEDYYQDFKIDDTIPSIFGWPARGNKYFARFNGFDLLPNDNQGLADFFDMDGNNNYDPDKGDYPVVDYHGYNFIIPDQMMWMVFNDVDTSNHTGKRPIRAEFQLTAFAFHCQDKPWLNNSIFTKYKIINRAVTPIDSLFLGLWTDYDLGCSTDDYMGSDSARHTEFVYNADMTDGDAGAFCTTGSDTYPARPPVQSMTWLSHPMHSFVSQEYETGFILDKYNLLNGQWADGTPIRPQGDGYNVSPVVAPTRFLFNGDPRDPGAWAAINVLNEGKEQRSVSSALLGRLDPGALRYVYTAHMFHHDPEADHLGQITHMYNNVDSLLAMTWHPHDPICTPVQTCMDDDCVWPGDFDKNGIADHRDYLTWGALNGKTGPGRNGLISWRGHFGEDWNETYSGTDVKHGDGDGNGSINLADIDVNSENHLLTNRFYVPEANYPVGDDIVIIADSFFNSQGMVRNFSVRTGHHFDNMLGISFTIEYDTAIFSRSPALYDWPEGISSLIYHPFTSELSTHLDVAFIQTNNLGVPIDADYTFVRMLPSSFRLKPGVSMPDSTVIRLKNLKAIDQEGHDLLLGSAPFVVYRDGFVGITDPYQPKTKVYPNPGSDVIYVETEPDTEAQIYTIHGNLIRHMTVDDLSKPIDVSDILPGIYILRIQTKGETIKLVIQ